MQPVIIFTYNRPDHLNECIKSLKKNHFSSVTNFFIIQDKLKKSNPIILEKYKLLFKTLPPNFKVIKRINNYGLKRNIIDGVSLILKKYKKVIICEDDLIFHKDYLNYMNFMLKQYSSDKKISSISGFSYVLKNQFNLFPREYLLTLTSSWGWATKREHWQEFLSFNSKKYKKILFKDKNMQYSFNYDNAQSHTLWLKKNSINKISSWNIEWEFFNFIKNYYTLYPKNTYVENKGFDGSGVHCNNENYKFQLINNRFKFKKSNKRVLFSREKKILRDIIKKNIDEGLVKKILKKIVYFNYID